jgi:poly(A) polymerase
MGEGWRAIAPAAGEQAARALLYRLKGGLYTDRVLLAWARSQGSAHDQDWRALVTLPEHWTVPAFPLKAADFIARGVEKGPVLGAMLRAAEEAWIAAEFPEAAAALDAIAIAAMQSPAGNPQK